MMSAVGATSSCLTLSTICTRRSDIHPGLATAFDADDIIAVGDGSVTGTCGRLPPQEFTAAYNPFLFPRGLLTELAHRRQGEGGSRSSAGAGSHPAAAAASVREDGAFDRPRWHLVHSKPRQEKKLAEHLRSLGIPHYLPVTKCKAITRGRARFTQAPQFPGYLFLWADATQRRTALETNRIVAAHGVDDQQSLSEQLWDLADLIEKGVPLRVEERLQAGQHVRVKAGVLKNKQGTIIKRGGKTRLFVMVNELLGGVSLEIEQHLLEPY